MTEIIERGRTTSVGKIVQQHQRTMQDLSASKARSLVFKNNDWRECVGSFIINERVCYLGNKPTQSLVYYLCIF